MPGRRKRLTGRSKYYVIDGGSGADQIAAARRRIVDSPRHADALWIIEPVSKKLMPAVAEARRALGEIQELKPEPFTIQVPSKEQREHGVTNSELYPRLVAGPAAELERQICFASRTARPKHEEQ